jgi:hypothetical protein
MLLNANVEMAELRWKLNSKQYRDSKISRRLNLTMLFQKA